MKLVKRIFLKRQKEADLNKESCNAAIFYINKQGPGVPLNEKISMTNYVAHGFYMGARWMEEQLGAKNVEK